MTEIEKIQRYIAKTRLSKKATNAYCMTFGDMSALYRMAREEPISALDMAFSFGQAKGYRAEKAEMKEATA